MSIEDVPDPPAGAECWYSVETTLANGAVVLHGSTKAKWKAYRMFEGASRESVERGEDGEIVKLKRICVVTTACVVEEFRR